MVGVLYPINECPKPLLLMSSQSPAGVPSYRRPGVVLLRSYRHRPEFIIQPACLPIKSPEQPAFQVYPGIAAAYPPHGYPVAEMDELRADRALPGKSSSTELHQQLPRDSTSRKAPANPRPNLTYHFILCTSFRVPPGEDLPGLSL